MQKTKVGFSEHSVCVCVFWWAYKNSRVWCDV